MSAVDLCSHKEPHVPHRYQMGGFGIKDCPGVPWPADASLTAREAAALDEADEQRARAEAAEQRFHSAEDDISAARAAVRAGDWDALWRALGIPATERLPQMRTALASVGRCGNRLPSLLGKDLAVACALPYDHVGWHRSDGGTEWGLSGPARVAGELLELGGLTVEQEIRVEALHAASRITIDAEGLTVRDAEQTIIGTAERYADWIATGSTESWDWQTQTYPEPQRWAWVGCEACRRGVCAGHPSPETKPATLHFSPNCACGINDAGERVVDPICARLSTEG